MAELTKRTGRCLNDSSKTIIEHCKNRQQQDQCKIVNRSSLNGASFFYSPDTVKTVLDIRKEENDGIEQQDNTDTGKNATLGMLQRVIYKPDNCLDSERGGS